MTENDIPGTGILGDSQSHDETPRAESPDDGLALPPFLAVLLRRAKAESVTSRVPDSLLGAWADFEIEGKKT